MAGFCSAGHKYYYVANGISDLSAKLGSFDIMTFSVTRYPPCGKYVSPWWQWLVDLGQHLRLLGYC